MWKHSPAHEIFAKLHLDPAKLSRVLLLADRPYWERVASYYTYALRQHLKYPSRYIWASETTFKTYLREPPEPFDTIPEFACDAEGRPLITEIVPFDGLEERFVSLAKEIGLEGAELPQLNRSQTPVEYRSFYDAEDWAVLGTHFAEEIAFLKSFGRPVSTDWVDTSAPEYWPEGFPGHLEVPATQPERRRLRAIRAQISPCSLPIETTFETPVRFGGRIVPGAEVSIGAYSVVHQADLGACRIGRFCFIEVGALIGRIPPAGNWTVANAPHWNKALRAARTNLSGTPSHLGHDVTVGQGAIVDAGVEVGTGAVIAPYAHVTEDVPPYAYVAGAPAQVTGYRFEAPVREALLDMAWWNTRVPLRMSVPGAQQLSRFQALCARSPKLRPPRIRAWELGAILSGVVPPYLVEEAEQDIEEV